MDFVKSNHALAKAMPYHLLYTLDVNLLAKDILSGRFMLKNLFSLNLIFFLGFPSFWIILVYYRFLKQFDLFIEDIHKSNDNASNSVTLFYLFFPGLHEWKHYNWRKLPKKSASRRIVLMIVTTLMKVRRKAFLLLGYL